MWQLWHEKKNPNFFYCDSLFKTLLCLTEMGVLAQRATPLVGGCLIVKLCPFLSQEKVERMMLNIFFCIFVASVEISPEFPKVGFLTWKENKSCFENDLFLEWQNGLNDWTWQGLKVKLMMMRLGWHNQDSLWLLHEIQELQLGMLKVKVEVNQMLIGMEDKLGQTLY